MLKLYRSANGVKEYWEAWATPNEITVHWGKLGEEGESRQLPVEPSVNPNETIKREAKPILAAGFKPLKRSQISSIVIQYKTVRHRTTDDLDRRVEIEELMNDRLGWTGLGHCDGGDIGNGTMNVFCYVADAGIAETVIVHELESHGFLDGAVIAQRIGDDWKVLSPSNFTGEFSLI